MRGAPGFSDGNGDFLSGYVYCRQNNTRKWGAQRAQHQKNAYFGKCGTATTTLTMLARAMRGAPGSPDGMGISLEFRPFSRNFRVISRNSISRGILGRIFFLKPPYFFFFFLRTSSLPFLGLEIQNKLGEFRANIRRY